METDSKGDIIIAGLTSSNSFLSTYKFPLIQGNISYTFIAKIDGQNGKVKWIRKQTTKTTARFWQGNKIFLDKHDNIHFVGWILPNDTVVLESSFSDIKINSQKVYQHAFVKYGSNGDVLSITKIDPSLAVHPIGDFLIDDEGKYWFTNIIDQYAKVNLLGKQINNGENFLCYLAAIDTLGKAKMIIYDSSSLYGCFGATCQSLKIDNRNNIYLLNYSQPHSIFIFDKQLQLINSKYFPIPDDKNYIKPTNIELDLNGNVYCTGEMKGKTKFAGKSYNKSTYVPFICKLDSNLNEAWLLESDEQGLGLLLSRNDSSNSIYLTGNFKKQINFGGKKKGNIKNEDKVFAAKFNLSGSTDWIGVGENAPNMHPYFDKLLAAEDKCGDFYISFCSINNKESFDGLTFDKTNNNSKYFGISTIITKYINDTTQYLKFSATTYCGDSFKLYSNFPAEYTKLYWFYNGNIIDSNKREIKYSFEKSGKYPITVLGIKNNGCQHTNTDTVTFFKKPEVKFTSKGIIACEHSDYQFINQSTSDTIKSGYRGFYLWDFGDGITDTTKNPLHIYTKSGKFTVSLLYFNGFCESKIEQVESVEILAAPKPGFTVNDTIGCVPFTVNVKDNSQGEVQKYTYTFGKEFTSSDANPTYTFTKPGIYWVSQKLLGATSCITSDSLQIRIRDGILPTEKPEMLRATFVNNNTVEISWEKHPLAESYSLYKQYDKNTSAALQKHFLDTVYMDNVVSLTQPFHYYITATDSCGNLSAQSLIAKPVILQGENIENKYILLRGTEYEKWENGVTEYVLEMQDIYGNFTSVNNSTQTNYTDSLRDINHILQQCYRLKAIEKEGNKQISYSNTVCVDHLPQLFIPDAFSPNKDTLNERFTIYTIGIREYTISIYNRWGELVYTGDKNSASWDGKFKHTICEDGNYFFQLQARSRTGENIRRTGYIKLLK